MEKVIETAQNKDVKKKEIPAKHWKCGEDSLLFDSRRVVFSLTLMF